jgi:hypothetical protein
LLQHPTFERLRELGLEGMARSLRDLAGNPESKALDHIEWLGILLEHEIDLPSVNLDTGLPMWESDERTETEPSHIAGIRGNGAEQAGAALERGTQTRRRPEAAAG